MAVFAKRYRLSLGLMLILLGTVLSACGASAKAPDQIHILTWDGIVNPVMERYINRGIDTAERSDARAVVIRLDTPGGLDSSMRQIIQRMEASTVPVIVYVSPAGSRAASAGTFITMAGHVAAMAPNTTIGAATPVTGEGDDIGGAMERKVTNDAVAYIRSIAELRDRNADWAEQAVRDAVAVSSTDAVSLNVVDFVAVSLEDLLRQSHGRQVEVKTDAGAVANVTLDTADVPVVANDRTFFENLLYVIADPNIAFLLLTLGGLAIVAEIFSTNGITGIFGVIAIVFAFFALGSLPTNWAGVALITFGFVLITAEVFVTGFGVLGIGGIVALLFGGLILTGGNEIGFQVSRWLVFGVTGVIGAIILGFAGVLLKTRRMPVHSGRESLMGARGIARSRLDPDGTVWVEGERWEATAEDGAIEDNTPIIVTGKRGLRLQVKRDPASIRLLPAASTTAQT